METIGIINIDPWFVLDDEPLVTNLYYFDRLLYTIQHKDTLEKFCNSLPQGKDKFREKIQEIDKLEKAGLITEYTHTQFDSDKRNFPKELDTVYALKALELSSNFVIENKPFNRVFVDFLERFREVGQLYARVYAIVLNQNKQDSYTPIIKSNYYNFENSELYSTNMVLSVLLKKFPIITDEVQLEKILDFKNDPDTKLKLSRLKDWVLEISKKNYSEKEIEQKIDYLLREYTSQIELHKLKHSLGTIETFVSISLEVLENLIKINFSKAAKVLFDLKKQHLALLEAEQKMTGKELALLYKLDEIKSR